MDKIRLLNGDGDAGDGEYLRQAVCNNCDKFSYFAIIKAVIAQIILIETPCPHCGCKGVLEKYNAE